MSRLHPSALILLAFLTLPLSGGAVTLDWDTAAWTNGSLNGSFEVDPTRAGTDVSLAVTGSTTQFTGGLVSPNPPTPAITRAFDGGLSPGEKSLELAIDLSNSNNQSVTVTFTFSAAYTAGVSNVVFNIFDIDKQATGSSDFEDKITSIVATLTNGTTVDATITNVGSSTKLTTGLNQSLTGIADATDLGPTSAAGNATISFLVDNIRSISFVYGSGAGASTNSTYQHIGIGDMTYSPVPELNPSWTAIASCLAAFGLVVRHGAKFRK